MTSTPAVADVAAPAWWGGKTCDTNNYPASYPLGASYDGVIACGPGPYNQGGIDHLVNFYSGAWGEYEWECTELVMRYMYQVYGVAPYSAVGSTVVSNYGGSTLIKVSNNGGSLPSPGDIVSFAGTSANPNGHTAVITAVNVTNGTGSLTIMEQNATSNGWGSVAVSGGKVTGTVLGGGVTGWLHNPGSNPAPPPSGNTATYNSTSLAGHFVAGDTGQDFIYITRRPDDGWDVAAWKATANSGINQLTWGGLFYQQPGPNITFENTVFFTGDANGDGLTDLYYATNSSLSSGGFTVGILYNTGNSFVYGGTVWTAPSNMSLNNVRFLPGDWTGSGKQGFAYADPTSDGGFEVSVFGVNAQNAFYWAGVWFTQPGPNVSFYNTEFVPLDASGDGKMDLYYASAQNWSSPGFTVGYLHNTGSSLQWLQSVWAPSNLSLNNVKFIPGYWTGGPREGFMYVTRNADGGFSTAVYTPDVNGDLVWDGGNWWIQNGSDVGFSDTQFIPADYNGDGYTDLFYATSENWSAAPYSLGLWENTTGHYAGVKWIGNQGYLNASPQDQTVFMPGI